MNDPLDLESTRHAAPKPEWVGCLDPRPQPSRLPKVFRVFSAAMVVVFSGAMLALAAQSNANDDLQQQLDKAQKQLTAVTAERNQWRDRALQIGNCPKEPEPVQPMSEELTAQALGRQRGQ